MRGKRTEWADWIRSYLKEQGADISDWEEYKVLYNRYAGRIRKYHPENYEQFLTTCTFAKQTKKECGAKDLGESKPKERPFDEEKWWKDQKKEWELYKLRMQHYRDDRIHNQKQQGETGREKDLIPYAFKLALKCLAGRIPIECYPEELEVYREELQNLLDEETFLSLNVKKEK